MTEHHGHQADAADIHRLHQIAAALGAGLVIAVAGTYWLSIATFDRGGYRHVVGEGAPSPRLQVHPREDLAMLRARENARLRTYAWTDRTTGIARIPIDRAMALLVQERANDKQETPK